MIWGTYYHKFGQNIKFSKFYVQNIWKVVRWWHHQLTHLHIHIDWSRNVLWKFAKLQSVITSLFFNRFHQVFTVMFGNFYSFFWNLVKPVVEFFFKGRDHSLFSSLTEHNMNVLTINLLFRSDKHYWTSSNKTLRLKVLMCNHKISIFTKTCKIGCL